MKRKSILEIIDSLAPMSQLTIDPNQVQAYRNSASTLKKLKHKHYVIRKIGENHVIFRLL